ncbi:MAG TPA: uroporphyrinogen-III synthase [Burkholderiales bacterium]
MSLAGRGVVVTRPSALAAGLAARIEAAGGRAIRFPAIKIEDLPRPAALKRTASYDLAIFISPTAVDKAVGDGRRWPRVAAVGAGTRQALEARGVSPVIAPQGEADSEALLALPELRQVAGQRVLIVRGEGGRALLGETLTKRGARVEYAECYRRTRPRADPTPLLSSWAGGAVHAVTVNSGEALENFAALLGEAGAARLRSTPLFVPHARITAQAERLGVRQTVVAGPTDEEMLRRLVAYFSS